jgi:hypothetical protein
MDWQGKMRVKMLMQVLQAVGKSSSFRCSTRLLTVAA